LAQVYAIDTRNHGESPHTELHSYPLISTDIKLFMQTQNMMKASVLGHSMGGRAAIYFALENPDLVEKLIIVDISPVGRIGN
jgi:pimeloyl-ACP methyl ester carboxylesterase